MRHWDFFISKFLTNISLQESEVPDLYKSLYPGENPTHSTPFMMTALKNKHVKKMYDDGVLWIYVKEPK